MNEKDKYTQFQENSNLNKKLKEMVNSHTFMNVIKNGNSKYMKIAPSKFQKKKQEWYFCKNPDLLNSNSRRSAFSKNLISFLKESCIFCEKESPFKLSRNKYMKKNYSQDDLKSYDLEKETKTFDYNAIVAKAGGPKILKYNKYNID